MICAHCLIDFPAGLVNEFVMGGHGEEQREFLCGDCAETEMRRIHGDATLEFHGPRAREIARQAKQHKEQLAKQAKGGRT